MTLFSILDENDSPLLSENAYVSLGLGATCTGAHDGSTPATCAGTGDGAGQSCALNADQSACAVAGGDCEFAPASGNACALNPDSSACVVEGAYATSCTTATGLCDGVWPIASSAYLLYYLSCCSPDTPIASLPIVWLTWNFFVFFLAVGGECVYSAYNPTLASLQMDDGFIESNQMHAINGLM